MFDFDKHLADLSDQTVLCVGDLMLDEFVYGEVSRISPEAPTPVIACKRSELMVGGAGNVARNLVSLGTRCVFVGVVGDDDAGRALTDALAGQPLIEYHLVVDGARQTTRKVRFVSEHHSMHMLRADWENAGPIDTASEESRVDSRIARDFSDASSVKRRNGLKAIRSSEKPASAPIASAPRITTTMGGAVAEISTRPAKAPSV